MPRRPHVLDWPDPPTSGPVRGIIAAPAGSAFDAHLEGASERFVNHNWALNIGVRETRRKVMTGNKAVAYKGPGKVELIDIDYPTFELKDGPGVNPANVGRSVRHGVILKTVATNICGSDQHMVRGRTTAPADLVLGHEITGEVVEVGPDVEFIKVGDICSVPFNIACGRCRNCKERKTGICLNVNPDRPGSAYGYVDMGGWVGGQANYVLVP